MTAFQTYLEDNDLEDVITTEPQVTAGATASLRMLDNDEVDVAAGVSNFDLTQAPDEGDFEDDPLQDYDNIRQVRATLDNHNFLVAEEGSGLETYDDLDGAIVSLGSPGAGTRPLWDLIAEQALHDAGAEIQYVEFGSQPDELRAGRIDAAAAYVNNVPYSVLPGFHQELDATVDWQPIDPPQDLIDYVDEEVAFATPVEYDTTDDSESYQGPVQTFRLSYSGVVKAGLDYDVVHELTRLMHEEGEAILEQDASAGYLADPDLGLGGLHPDLPVHEAAYDYYEEVGIWDDYDLTPPPEA